MKKATILAAVCLLLASCNGTSDNSVRAISYNIQDGMWYDEPSGYDNFVEWVKSQDPDVMGICEGSNHRNQERVRLDHHQRYLPTYLPELALRWGHPYSIFGPYQDNYPVAFTSKYPIEMVEFIGKKMSHGALHVKIRDTHYVVLHLWPLGHSMGDKTRSDGKGEDFRISEINNVLDLTIRNPKFKNVKNWVMMGDFNSHSSLDAEYLKGKDFRLHDIIRSLYVDSVGESHPDEFIPSITRGGMRIDFIYLTPNLYETTTRAESIVDDFTTKASDHLPVVVEFKE